MYFSKGFSQIFNVLRYHYHHQIRDKYNKNINKIASKGKDENPVTQQ